MWPLDLGRRNDVLRVGAHAVELWRWSGSGLTPVGRVALAERVSLYAPAPLGAALHALAGQLEQRRVAVVLESALAPVLLVDTGGMLTRREQLQALLRHRFGLAYGEPGVDVASWKVRTGHRFGDRFALGYALPPAVELVLTEAGGSATVDFAAWQPALDWSVARFDPARRWSRRAGWWVWPEQDRSLVIRLSEGRCEALNPASRLLVSTADILCAVAAEGAKLGVDAVTTPIGVGHWRLQERPVGQQTGIDVIAVEAEGKGARHPSSGADQALRAVAR